MNLGRREIFKILGLAGATLGAPQVTGSFAAAQWTAGATAPRQRAASGTQKVEWAPAVKDDELNPADWPFKDQEVRIPFRERKGKVKWPNGAKLCIRPYVTFEWDSALNPEGSLYQPSLFSCSHSAHMSNVGIYRALDLVEKHGIKVAFFPHGGLVSAFPNIVKEFHSLGHEITARSSGRWATPVRLNGEQQASDIRRVTDAISQITGERPVGWIAPGAQFTHRTPEILADLGYLWWGDHDGDDIPFGVRFGSKMLVAMPHRAQTMQDRSILWTGIPVPQDPVTGFEFFKNTFDAIYHTATEEYPLMFIWGIHPDISCSPDRIVWNDRCLGYMKGFKNVWFARERDVAQYWKENYLS